MGSAAGPQRFVVLQRTGTSVGSRRVVPRSIRRSTRRRARATDVDLDGRSQLGERSDQPTADGDGCVWDRDGCDHRHRCPPRGGQSGWPDRCRDRRGVPEPVGQRRPGDVGECQLPRDLGGAVGSAGLERQADPSRGSTRGHRGRPRHIGAQRVGAVRARRRSSHVADRQDVRREAVDAHRDRHRCLRCPAAAVGRLQRRPLRSARCC